MERVYNKLVRDKIPNIIEEKGEKAIVRYLNDFEYKVELEKKLFEEYKETVEASGEERIEELADMLEVIIALAKLENFSLEGVLEKLRNKKIKRGGFDKKIFLEKVIESD